MVQSRPVAKETWMTALVYHMNEAGASPASTLAASNAEEAQYKAVEEALFHDLVRRGQDKGGNGKNPPQLKLQGKVDPVILLEVLMSHRLEAISDNLRRLQDASQACEVRRNNVFLVMGSIFIVLDGLLSVGVYAYCTLPGGNGIISSFHQRLDDPQGIELLVGSLLMLLLVLL